MLYMYFYRAYLFEMNLSLFNIDFVILWIETYLNNCTICNFNNLPNSTSLLTSHVFLIDRLPLPITSKKV